MSISSPSFQTIEERIVRLRMRPDLVVERQTQQGQAWWVIKDPLSLKYYRLREEQYHALTMLDGKTSIKDIQESVEKNFPSIAVAMSDLQSLFLIFHRSGMVLSEGAGQQEALLKRRGDYTKRQWLSKLMSLLWIKLPGVDPDRFLTWFVSKLSFVFHPILFAFSLFFVACALLLVLVHFEQFNAKLPAYEEFFVASNLVWLMAGLAISKILHELGHALACKYYGGECHQIGIMLLVFTPCLYCDTSDSWMLRSKWQRAAVGAAGMYVEIVLAAICTFIWWNTHPGLVHYLCLSIMTVSSISTLVFNSNPLLRYDGYYILSDLIEIPNLSNKAQVAVKGVVERWLFDSTQKLKKSLPQQYRGFFAFYAIASPIYRWVVVILILWVVSEVFEPYGLKSIGYLLISMSIIGMLVTPIWQLIKYLRRPGRLRQLKITRVFITSAFLIGSISLILLVPIPHYVIAPVILQPHDAERVYVNVPGSIDEMMQSPGQKITAGATIAVLQNDEIKFEVARLTGRLQRLESELQSLRRRQSDDNSAVRSIPQLIESITGTQERLRQLASEQNRLRLTAPVAGVILEPPVATTHTSDQIELSSFAGSPFEPENQNAWLPTGTLFCLVGDPQKVSALLVIGQSKVDRVEKDQLVEIKFKEAPLKTWTGRIAELNVDRMEVVPREMATKFGGSLATEIDSNGQERPLAPSYEARVVITSKSKTLLPGFRGVAKIHVGKQTLFKTIRENFMNVFRFH